MKTKLLFILLITAQFSFAQSKSRADRFFEKGDYINAAIQYEEELNQKGYEKHILENISTSYYNTFQFKDAYRYLKILTSGKFYGKDKSYDNSYNFMMYQVLSALGGYEKALPYLATYQENKGAVSRKTMEAIQEIEAFKLKDDDFRITPAEFNTGASEFGAVKVDSTVYFISDRQDGILPGKEYKWTHRSFLDIYKVKVAEQNVPVSEVEKLESDLNSKLHDGNFCFSKDGNTIYFSRNYIERGKRKLDSLGRNPVHLYKAVKKDGAWSKQEHLSFNTLEASAMHPSLNADESVLYFSSNAAGGYGDFDIYQVTIDADGIYGKMKNLGETINTDQREQFPFISKKIFILFEFKFKSIKSIRIS